MVVDRGRRWEYPKVTVTSYPSCDLTLNFEDREDDILDTYSVGGEAGSSLASWNEPPRIMTQSAKGLASMTRFLCSLSAMRLDSTFVECVIKRSHLKALGFLPAEIFLAV